MPTKAFRNLGLCPFVGGGGGALMVLLSYFLIFQKFSDTVPHQLAAAHVQLTAGLIDLAAECA